MSDESQSFLFCRCLLPLWHLDYFIILWMAWDAIQRASHYKYIKDANGWMDGWLARCQVRDARLLLYSLFLILVLCEPQTEDEWFCFRETVQVEF